MAERLLARVDKAMQAEASPIAALEAIFLTHIDFVAGHPGVPRPGLCEITPPRERLPTHTGDALPRGSQKKTRSHRSNCGKSGLASPSFPGWLVLARAPVPSAVSPRSPVGPGR